MSFFKSFLVCFLIGVVITFLFGLLVYSASDEETPVFGIAFVSFIVGVFIGLFYTLTTKCPKCKKYLCFQKQGHEDLSRDVVSKKVKDKELGTKLEHYAVGKRKYYYKCNSCGHESTSIKDYKDKIDV